MAMDKKERREHAKQYRKSEAEKRAEVRRIIVEKIAAYQESKNWR